MDETIVHAYGVVAADEPLTQFPPGIADTTVWVYGADSLAAIVSLLPVEGFGVADWERNATNVGWLERVARQHHEVLRVRGDDRRGSAPTPALALRGPRIAK